MSRLAGALARVLIVVAVALSTASAAHPHTFAQVKCVGLYCAIVSVPGPHHEPASTRRKQLAPKLRLPVPAK